VFRLSRAVMRGMMKARWGRIININFGGRRVGQRRPGDYAAAKAGVVGMTKSLARELGSRNITVKLRGAGIHRHGHDTGIKRGAKERAARADSTRAPGRRQRTSPPRWRTSLAAGGYVNRTVLHVNGGIICRKIRPLPEDSNGEHRASGQENHREQLGVNEARSRMIPRSSTTRRRFARYRRAGDGAREEFETEIPDEEAEKITTVQQAVDTSRRTPSRNLFCESSPSRRHRPRHRLSLGNSVQEAWDKALAGTSGITRITRFDPSRLASQIAGEVKRFDVAPYMSPSISSGLDRGKS